MTFTRSADAGEFAVCSPAAALRHLWRHRGLLIVSTAIAGLAALAPVFQSARSNQLEGTILLKLGGNSVRGVSVEIPKQVQVRLQRRFGNEGFQSVVRAQPAGSVLLIRFVEADGDRSRLEAHLQEAARFLVEAHKQKAAELFAQVPNLEIGFADSEVLGPPRIQDVDRAPAGLGARLSEDAALGLGIGALLTLLSGPARKTALLRWRELPSAIQARDATRYATMAAASAIAAAAFVLVLNGWPPTTTRASVDMQMGGQWSSDGFLPVETLSSVRDRLSAMFEDRGFTGVDPESREFGRTTTFRITFQGSGDVSSAIAEATQYLTNVHRRLLARWIGLPHPSNPPVRPTISLGAPVIGVTGVRRVLVAEAILGGALGAVICLLAASQLSIERRPPA